MERLLMRRMAMRKIGGGVELYDWIQGDGIAYIATDITPIAYPRFDVKFDNINHDNGGQYVFNTRHSDNAFGIDMGGAGTTARDQAVLQYFNMAMTQTVAYGIHDWSIYKPEGVYKREVYDKGSQTVIYSSNFNSIYGVPTDSRLTLFAAKDGSGPFTGRIYYLDMYNNDTLVCQMRPAVVNGEAGMYDILNGVFYGNSASSGTFTVGNN